MSYKKFSTATAINDRGPLPDICQEIGHRGDSRHNDSNHGSHEQNRNYRTDEQGDDHHDDSTPCLNRAHSRDRHGNGNSHGNGNLNCNGNHHGNGNPGNYDDTQSQPQENRGARKKLGLKSWRKFKSVIKSARPRLGRSKRSLSESDSLIG